MKNILEEITKNIIPFVCILGAIITASCGSAAWIWLLLVAYDLYKD